MRYNEIDILPDGCLRLRMIPPFFSDILAQLPSILDGQIPIQGAPDWVDPEAELFPSVYAATELEADEDWRKYGRPDLIALFASRREIIDQDLESLVDDFYLIPFFDTAQRLALQAEDGDRDMSGWDGEGPWEMEFDEEDCSEEDIAESDQFIADHPEFFPPEEDQCLKPDAESPASEDHEASESQPAEEEPALEGEQEDEGDEFVEVLGQLARPVMPLRRLLIPAAHRSAWMSSLNGARLLIANCFGFMDAMPERELEYDPEDPAQLALLLMDALGELEHLLVEVERAEGFDPS